MMKETKTCFRFFSIMDYEKEADFLRKMHKKGWKFVKVSLGGFYGFEACEPEDVVYQLGLSIRMNIFRCSRTADGSICRILWDIVISVSLFRRWMEMNRFSVMMNPDWIWLRE